MTVKVGDFVRWVPTKSNEDYGMEPEQLEFEKRVLGKVLEVIHDVVVVRLGVRVAQNDDGLAELLSTEIVPIAAGDRVEFKRDVERFPLFIVPAGTVGKVVHVEEFQIGVLPDTFITGAEEWENIVWWYAQDDTGDEFIADIVLEKQS